MTGSPPTSGPMSPWCSGRWGAAWRRSFPRTPAARCLRTWWRSSAAASATWSVASRGGSGVLVQAFRASALGDVVVEVGKGAFPGCAHCRRPVGAAGLADHLLDDAEEGGKHRAGHVV